MRLQDIRSLDRLFFDRLPSVSSLVVCPVVVTRLFSGRLNFGLLFFGPLSFCRCP